ncbi:MAG: hypothetical protein RLZZ15_2560 [Verrucomicrobiota bacterium]|jgi:hypothetical protein
MKREALNAFAAEIMASAQASVAEVASAAGPGNVVVELRLTLSIHDPETGALARRETITQQPAPRAPSPLP